MPGWEKISLTDCDTGVFVANADESFMIATYSTIASEFNNLSDGQWLLIAYNMGYCYALPIVR